MIYELHCGLAQLLSLSLLPQNPIMIDNIMVVIASKKADDLNVDSKLFTTGNKF